MPVHERDAANAWDLRHISGNASEITMFCYATDPERLPPWTTTSEWLVQDADKHCARVFRGGSFALSMQDAHATARGVVQEDRTYPDLGFRIVKSLEP